MAATLLFQNEMLSVVDYRCAFGPGDRPFVELHQRHSISYVSKGSFGCEVRGKTHDLVAGSLPVGYPDDEYICTHEHHACGDECLSFQFSPELVDSLGGADEPWRAGAVPPLAELMVLGEQAQAVAEGRGEMGMGELSMALARRFLEILGKEKSKKKNISAANRRMAVEAALWIDQHSNENIGLEEAAAQAGSSQFHFLRLFSKAIGVTPHQYLVRSRLRRAAKLLAERERPVTDVALESGFADLSNFVRTFHRAAGVPPGKFAGRFAAARFSK